MKVFRRRRGLMMLTGLIAALVLVMAGCDSAGGLGGAACGGQRLVRRHPGTAIELPPTKERAATGAAR